MKSKGLDKLIMSLSNAIEYVIQLNGQSINVKDTNTFTSGPMLHKDSEELGGMDRYESAKLERDNQDATDFARHMGKEFHNRLKS